MSGHSKWSTIKRKKEALDQKRGQVFTRLARGITVAVKTGGGGDPDSNFSLRLAMDKARAANMPNDNIQRAIDRGLGKSSDGSSLDEFILEGYGPEGVAMLVEVVTDNRNRTVADIKNMFDKNGGSLAEPGSVMYLFKRVGEVVYKGKLSEDAFLELIDYGAEELNETDGGGFIISSPESVGRIADAMEKMGIGDIEVNVVYKPNVVNGIEKLDRFLDFVDRLRESDDVEEVSFNVEA